ncbi:MAG: hypothetical protein LBQ96_02790, partial [Fusobacteriaceae bacterium]|nr:hypothetical protein [Fusobacteriaceae bacterium]
MGVKKGTRWKCKKIRRFLWGSVGVFLFLLPAAVWAEEEEEWNNEWTVTSSPTDINYDPKYDGSDAKLNKLTIEEGDFYGDIYTGYADSKGVRTIENFLQMNSGHIKKGNLYGGYTIGGGALRNRVTIYGGIVDPTQYNYKIYGGYVKANVQTLESADEIPDGEAHVIGNVVNILNDASVGDVVGGGAESNRDEEALLYTIIASGNQVNVSG